MVDAMVDLPQRAAWRFLLRHPWQLGLAVLGVTLGVAVVVAVDLANTSASRAFALSLEQLYGRATHQVLGGPAGLDEQVYARLRARPGMPPMAPVVEGIGRLGDETVRLLGVDPLSDAAFRSAWQNVRLADSEAGGPASLWQAGSAYLAAPTARRLDLGMGDRATLRVAGRLRELRVAGLLEADRAAAIDGLLIADIATVQEWTGTVGRISRIDVKLDGDRVEAFRNILPQGVELAVTSNRGQATLEMTRAFGINLTAMSLLALVVAMFLIYNSITFLVLQRRHMLGVLRALGAARGQIFRLILKETWLLGVVGTALGLLLGSLLGSGLVRLVTRTISDHYFVLTVTQYLPGVGPLLQGAALGIGASLLAAALPAWEAARIPPHAVMQRSQLEAHSHRLAPRLALAGVASMGLGLVLLWWSQRSLVVGFGALFLLLIGIALTIPLLVYALTRVTAMRFQGIWMRLTVQGIGASLSRTGPAIAALTLAVATTVGVGVMVDSFRTSVNRWLQASLQADIYVSAVGDTTGGDLAPSMVEGLSALDGVEAYSLGRGTRLSDTQGVFRLFALELSPGMQPRYPLMQGDPAEVWPRWQRGEAVLISEPLAWRRSLQAGDRMELMTAAGRRTFPIAGVYRDYASEHGEVLMTRPLYEALFADAGISGMGLYLTQGASLQAMLDHVRRYVKQSAPHADIGVRSNAELRALSLEIFDRTFVITNVLKLLAVLVAFVGILSALMAVQLERAREMAVLRATGVTPGQVLAMVTAQTACMGLAAGVLALPTGLTLAALLTHVINRRAFGWSMELVADPVILVQGVALALVAALLAGVIPGIRMARSKPALALREE